MLIYLLNYIHTWIYVINVTIWQCDQKDNCVRIPQCNLILKYQTLYTKYYIQYTVWCTLKSVFLLIYNIRCIVHIHVYAYMYMYTWICIHEYAYMYIYTWICICIHVYVYMNMYTWIFICIHGENKVYFAYSARSAVLMICIIQCL